MKIVVFTICKNENPMVKFFLRHYSLFASKIVVWDEHSTDGTREILAANPLVDLRYWPHQGLNDVQFLKTVNHAWKDEPCDWVMWPDIDEMLYAPNVYHTLATAKEDVIRSIGYALISKDGFDSDDPRQIYEQVKTGVPQPNYDKWICWRSTVDMVHTIGRHTVPRMFPRTTGSIGNVAKLKLLHCHYIGGLEYAKKMNQRNYDRAVDKRFAWNYAPGHNGDPKQVGSVAWVERILRNNELGTVV